MKKNNPEQMRKDPKDPRHGSSNGYANLKCRCIKCRTAWSIVIQNHRLERRAQAAPKHVHGTENGYNNYGCRCDPCRAAWAEVSGDRRRARQARFHEARSAAAS